MSNQALELAELMGWKYEEREIGPKVIYPAWWNGEERKDELPAYDTDLNAMREVWAMLWERGLWDEFIACWQSEGTFKWDYLLHDLPGQVAAAIKVLK